MDILRVVVCLSVDWSRHHEVGGVSSPTRGIEGLGGFSKRVLNASLSMGPETCRQHMHVFAACVCNLGRTGLVPLFANRLAVLDGR